MIEVVSILAGLVVAFAVGFRTGRTRGREDGVVVLFSTLRDDDELAS